MKIIINANWLNSKDVLPTPDKLTVPILMVYEHKIYMGEYHVNGCFYIVKRPGTLTSLLGKAEQNSKYTDIPYVECLWCYVDDYMIVKE